MSRFIRQVVLNVVIIGNTCFFCIACSRDIPLQHFRELLVALSINPRHPQFLFFFKEETQKDKSLRNITRTLAVKAQQLSSPG